MIGIREKNISNDVSMVEVSKEERGRQIMKFIVKFYEIIRPAQAFSNNSFPDTPPMLEQQGPKLLEILCSITGTHLLSGKDSFHIFTGA